MSWLLPPLPPKFEAALRDVHAKSWEARIAAAERLGRASDEERPEALLGLREMLADKHPSVRVAALMALGSLADASVIDLVIAKLDDDSHEVAEVAALALAQLGGDKAITALRRALAHAAPQVRFQAVSALAELGGEREAQHVLALANDPDPEVRVQVAQACARIGVPHLSGHIAGLLEDENAGVRLEAALALAELSDARGKAVLLQALERRERVVEAASALSRLQIEESREPIAKVALGFLAPAAVRAELGAALVRLGDKRGEDALKRVLRGFRADARGLAVSLAGEVGAKSLVPELARLVQKPRGVDPILAVEALGMLAGTSQAATDALQSLRSLPGEVGSAARKALAPRES